MQERDKKAIKLTQGSCQCRKTVKISTNLKCFVQLFIHVGYQRNGHTKRYVHVHLLVTKLCAILHAKMLSSCDVVSPY